MNSKKINQLATELTPSLSDITIIGDPSTGISKKITLSQMASLFTGTVEEYANLAAFPLVGTADTIYIALDTNVIYRWNTGTSAYVELSPNIVTSLVFSDANGFDGTISLVGSTATLTITTALTTGSVPFIGASGALSQDNANLFFDDTNNRLGINTNAPTTALDVFGSGIIGRINGTSTNNAFLGFASAGSNKWSIGNVQSDHRFRIYNEATTSELVSVLSTGEFGIGIANPTTKLHIDGGATALIANLDANVSVAKSISFRSDNSNRINLEVSGTESGSNAGANFFLRAYSDAGALLSTPLTITRSTGDIRLSAQLIVDSKLYIGTTSAYGFNINSVADNGIYNRGGSTASHTPFLLENSSGSTIMQVLGNGNIGIATSSPNIGGYGTNSRVLTIQGVSGSYGILELTSNSANADGNAIGRLDFGSDGQAAGYKAISSIASFLSGSTSTKFGADLRFYTRANNAASGDPSERMRISRDGNFGFGTGDIVSTNLTGSLTVRKSYSGDSPNGATTQDYYLNQSALYLFGRNSGLTIVTNNNEEGEIIFANNSTRRYATIATGAGTSSVGGDMYFKVGSDAIRLRITSLGSIIIYANNSSDAFTVYGGNSLWSGSFEGSSTTNQSFGVVSTAGTSSSDTTFLARSRAGANYLQVRGDGNVRLNSTTYSNTASGSVRTVYIGNNDYFLGGISSIRESKKNIQEFTSEWIYNLKPVQFNYRKKDEEGNYTEEIFEEINYGLIAEDTEPIADFLINYNEKEDGLKEMVGIEYSRLITPMLKEIQELKKEIELLKAK